MNLRTFLSFLLLSVMATPAAAQTALSGGYGMTVDPPVPSQVFVREKVFVHTDKTVYLTGETCWLSLYCLNAADQRPLGASRVAYVEILSRNGQAVIQSKIALDSGFGAGSVNLPPTLSTGHYQLRAYTSWMQNFPADFFYTSDLTIINTLHGSSRDVADSSRKTSLAFFPEGGNLIAEITSRVACRASDAAGNPLRTRIEIRNSAGKLVTSTNTDSNGIARADITADPTETFYGIIAADSFRRFPLPSVVRAGYVLRVDRDQQGDLRVTVKTSASQENRVVYLATQNRQALKSFQSSRISGAAANFLVRGDSIGEGLAVVTLLDENRQPVAERVVFRQPGSQMQIETKTDQEQYDPRSPVRLTVNTSIKGKPAIARVSAAIFRLDALQDLPPENICSWLALRSELPDLPVSAARYVDRRDESGLLALDNIMLTSGWRRFRSSAQEGKSPVFHYLPEMEGQLLSARVVNRNTGQPVPGIPYLMATPGRQAGLSTSVSDGNGELLFASRRFSKSDPVILQPRRASDSGYRIDLSQPFSDSAGTTRPSSIQLDQSVTGDLTERHLAVQVQSSFKTVLPENPTHPEGNDTLPFYGIPDRKYHLADYTRFVTMEEVLREFVEDLRIRKDGTRFRFYIRNMLFSTFFDGDPLILLDGVPVSDPTKIVGLDPLKISDISIVTHRYIRGAEEFDGIVILRSLTGDAGMANLDPSSVIVDYAGLQERREFSSPDYSDANRAGSSLPDYRTTLWWSPDLRTGLSGNIEAACFTGDIPGRYGIVVEGISADGHPGYSLGTLTVRGNTQPTTR